jgi:hypothetical protein
MDHHSPTKKSKPKTIYVPSTGGCEPKTTKPIPRSSQPGPSSKKSDVYVAALAGWQKPFSIDDADLMFDGKPLNMLYEENRWMAGHRGDFRDQAACVTAVRHEGARNEGNRGRSRQSRK